MSELPKFVRQRLGQAAPQPHPDADLLTAFVERSLTAAERGVVLQHLATCAECREVVWTAAPEAAPQPVTAPERASATPAWFRWPALRWGTLAAALTVVVSAVLLEMPRKTAPQPQSARSEERLAAPRQEAPPPAPASPDTAPAEGKTMTAEQASKPAPLAKAGRMARNPARVPAVEEMGRTRDTVVARPAAPAASGAPNKDQMLVRNAAPPPPPVISQRSDDTSLREAFELKKGIEAEKRSELRLKAAKPKPEAAPAEAVAVESAAKPKKSARSQTGAGVGSGVGAGFGRGVGPGVGGGTGGGAYLVSGGVSAPRLVSQPPSTPAGGPLTSVALSLVVNSEGLPQQIQVARSSGGEADQKAIEQVRQWRFAPAMKDGKPVAAQINAEVQVPAGEAASGLVLGAAPAPTVRWAVSANARVQRSTDRGMTWQEVPLDPAIRFRAVTALGEMVWAGGEGGALFRSSDGGRQWKRVEVTDADIVRIEFFDRQHGAFTAANGDSWVTADGGSTWTLKK